MCILVIYNQIYLYSCLREIKGKSNTAEGEMSEFWSQINFEFKSLFPCLLAVGLGQVIHFILSFLICKLKKINLFILIGG